jgi:hypothetical protein
VKKIILAITLIVLSLTVTKLQINTINEKTLQLYEEVYLFSKDIPENTILKKEHLTLGKINSQWWSDDYIKESSDIIGKVVHKDAIQNSVVLKSDIQEKKPILSVEKEGYSLTTLKLKPEEALCWVMQVGDALSLYWVSEGHEKMALGKIIVRNMYTDRLEEKELNEMAIYMMVEGDQKVIEKIIQFRNQGRFEVSVANEGTIDN